MPPDFVGVGAQRSGTTWWHALVESHPDVHAQGWPFKERHFFDRFATDDFTERDVQAYREVFRRPRGRITGEWTPRYMYDVHTPALLHRAAPDARLLVMLRDPITRFRSGFTHALARGVARDEAWDEAQQRGMYFAQLSNVLASFPRDQLLVLQFERCVARPAEMLQHTFSFLGLSEFDAVPLGERLNRGRTPAPALAEQDEARLLEAYATDTASLLAEFPEIDVALWRAGDFRPS